MANRPEGEPYTLLDGLKFFGKRVIKLTPFNLFALGFGNCIGPILAGGGPYFDYYYKAFAGCKKYWWTNVFFINNLYPAAFDEKCMGWTWILPCYV